MRLIDYYNIAASVLMVVIVCGVALLSVRKTQSPTTSNTSGTPGKRKTAGDRGARDRFGLQLQGRGYWVVVLAVLAVGAFLRLWNLEGLPYGMQQDEASIGYEAYSLATYGIDRNGYSWPVYPITWGSGGGSPIMIYLNVITVLLFGSSVWSVRIVPAFLGTLTLVLFFAVLYRGFGRRTALTGLLLLSITPWHVILSRWSLDSNTTPFWQILAAAVFVLAVTGGIRRVRGAGASEHSNVDPAGYDMEQAQYTAANGCSRRIAHADSEEGSDGAAGDRETQSRPGDGRGSTGLLCLAAFLFGVCMYSYGSANVVVPLTLLFLSIWGLRHQAFTWRQLVGCGVTFVATCLPLIIFYAINFLGLPEIALEWISFPKFTSSHFSSVFVSFDASLPASILANLRGLLQTLTVGYSDEVAWNSMPEYWTLYKFTWPVVFAGMVWSVRKCWKDRKKERPDALSAVNAVMVSELIAALLFTLLIQASVNREVMLFLPLVYCLVMGLRWIYRSGVKYARGPAAARAALLLILAGAVSFCKDYYGGEYNVYAAEVFMPGYGEAMVYADGLAQEMDEAAGDTAAASEDEEEVLLSLTSGETQDLSDESPADESAQERATVYSTYNLVASPYMLTLFYTQYDTYDFMDTVEYREEEAEFRVATSFGHFVFGLPVEDTSDLSALMEEEYWGDVFVLTRVEAEQFDEMLYDITWFGDRFAVVVRRQE